jgi:hypothetical protein
LVAQEGFINLYGLTVDKVFKNPCKLVAKEGFTNPYDLPGEKVSKNLCLQIGSK